MAFHTEAVFIPRRSGKETEIKLLKGKEVDLFVVYVDISMLETKAVPAYLKEFANVFERVVPQPRKRNK